MHNFENILQEASKFDDRIDEQWMKVVGDKQYDVLNQFLDPENYPHLDIFSDEWLEVDTHKAQKKIIKGQDAVELINYAYDLGRLVGRAEQVLLNQ